MAERGQELLEHGLRDMYDAEHRFAKALETMIEQVQDSSLQEGFRRHLRVTKEQARRLEGAFDELGSSPEREECAGSKGLVTEYERFVERERPDPATLNAFAADAGLKVEQYEIAAYRSLLNLAQFLGLERCARAFRQNLAEEEQAAAELQSAGTRLAADLTGASAPGVMRRTAGSVFDQVREGALVAAETARSVGQQATTRTGQAIERAEKRGRKAVRTARARGQAARARPGKRSTSGRTTTTARKRTRKTVGTTRSRSTTRSRATGRKTAARRGTTSRVPSRGTARRRPARTTARSGRRTTRTRARS